MSKVMGGNAKSYRENRFKFGGTSLVVDGGGSKDTRAGTWYYELVGRSARGDEKHVGARQSSRRPVGARRIPALQ
jgi:hypothetical protein